MKNIITFIIIITISSSCSKKVIPTAETTYLTYKDGVLNLRSTGYCTPQALKDECIDEAQQNAFRTLFYRGIPGSEQSTPLISINEKDNSANEKLVKDFFSTGRYKTFIVSSINVSDIIRQNKQKKITVDLGINLVALRKDLEHKSIIPKFGY